MYKYVIFDVGGVLVDFSPRIFLMNHFTNEALEQRLFEITFGSEEWLKLDAGLLSREDAYAAMRKNGAEIGRAFEVDIILSDWMDMLRTKEETVRVIKRIKQNGYRVLYLSNISADILAELRRRQFWTLFDGGVASCEVKVNKPDPRIFKALLQKYRLKASECVFVDDTVANVTAAVSMGIAGIHFKNASRLAQTLNGCGVKLAPTRGR